MRSWYFRKIHSVCNRGCLVPSQKKGKLLLWVVKESYTITLEKKNLIRVEDILINVNFNQQKCHEPYTEVLWWLTCICQIGSHFVFKYIVWLFLSEVHIVWSIVFFLRGKGQASRLIAQRVEIRNKINQQGGQSMPRQTFSQEFPLWRGLYMDSCRALLLRLVGGVTRSNTNRIVWIQMRDKMDNQDLISTLWVLPYRIVLIRMPDKMNNPDAMETCSSGTKPSP